VQNPQTYQAPSSSASSLTRSGAGRRANLQAVPDREPRTATPGAVSTVTCAECWRLCTLKPTKFQLTAWCEETIVDRKSGRDRVLHWCEECGPKLYTREVAA